MENPTLELRDSNGGLLQTNDNWIDSPDRQQIIDTTIAPANNLESAIVATLPAQNTSYTAIVRGVNNTTGIAAAVTFVTFEGLLRIRFLKKLERVKFAGRRPPGTWPSSRKNN